MAVKAQQTAQAIVRSPKDQALGSVEEGPIESPPSDHSDEEALLVENAATPLEDDSKQTMPDDVSKTKPNPSSATVDVRTLQAKLLEMAQANIQLSFEFAQRLAKMRSPLEFPSVVAEFTSRRIAMFGKHSTNWLK